MDYKPTLEQIALQAEVTVSTVHKALYNKKGVSPEKKRQILEIAEAYHYNKNNPLYHKAHHFAVVFPIPEGDNVYFYQPLWEGIRKKGEELSDFNIHLTEFYFTTSQEQNSILADFLADNQRTFDAVITIVWEEEGTKDLINQLVDQGTQVFSVSADAPTSKRSATVTTDHYRTGRLAAEFLGTILPEGSRTIILGSKRDPLNHQRSVRGFYDQMQEISPSTEIIECYDSSLYPERILNTLREMIASFKNVRAVYSNNARTTHAICSASPAFAPNIKLVGSELFPGSQQALSQGVLTAVIDQNAFQQGYKGVETAFSQVVCSKQCGEQILVPVNLLLRNSLPLET